MNNASHHSIWKDMKLRRKFSTISVAFTVVLAGLIAFNVLVLRSQSQQSLVTDMAGRQRMLSQKFAKEVVLVNAGVSLDTQGTLKLLRDSLAALMEGGEIITNLDTGARAELPAAPNVEIRAKLAEQAVALRQYEAVANAYLGLPSGDPRRADKLKELLVTQQALSDSAEAAVKMFSFQGEAAIRNMVLLQVVLGLVCAVAGLVVSSMIGRQLADPLAECAEAARKVAEGDLRIEPLEIHSSDEIAALQVAFNDMLASQRDVALQSRTVCDALTAAANAILS